MFEKKKSRFHSKKTFMTFSSLKRKKKNRSSGFLPKQNTLIKTKLEMVNTAMYLKDSKNINRKIQINHMTVGTYIYSFLGMIYSMAVNILMLRKQFSLSSPSESLARNTLSELRISV